MTAFILGSRQREGQEDSSLLRLWRSAAKEIECTFLVVCCFFADRCSRQTGILVILGVCMIVIMTITFLICEFIKQHTIFMCYAIKAF